MKYRLLTLCCMFITGSASLTAADAGAGCGAGAGNSGATATKVLEATSFFFAKQAHIRAHCAIILSCVDREKYNDEYVTSFINNAIFLLTGAAREGNKEAQYYLGYYYSDEETRTTKSLAEQRTFIEKAPKKLIEPILRQYVLWFKRERNHVRKEELGKALHYLTVQVTARSTPEEIARRELENMEKK